MMLPTMPDVWTLLNTPAAELLGWTLLHFVWQGALLAALLAGMLRLLHNHSPQGRYVIACASLAGLLLLPVGTGLFLADQRPASASAPPSSGVAELPPADMENAGRLPVAALSSRSTPSWQARAVAWFRPALPWIVLGWGLGVLGFSVRLAGGAWRVRRLRRTGPRAPEAWQEQLRTLADQLGLRHSVSLRQSSSVESPMVTGWWRPVVLVPTGLLTGLPPEQVEALLLHELAHIRRHDVLVGRLQAVVEILFFFHPATWWISRQVRRAREACCDDLAVQAGAERAAYAQALTTLAERALAEGPMAWTPAASHGSLISRIRRLLKPPSPPTNRGRRLSIAAAMLLLVAFPVGLAACASQQSTTGTEDTVQASSAPSDSSSRSKSQATATAQDDSTEYRVIIHTKRPIVADTMSDGAYNLRGDGGDRLDTLRSFSGKESEPDSDSLERLIRSEIQADSLARFFARRALTNSLEGEIFEDDVWADRLSRELTERFEDSTFVFSPDIDVDSLPGWPNPHADRIFQALEHRFADSTRGVNWDAFEKEIDVDSLLSEREVKADGLLRWREKYAETFRHRLDSLRTQARQHADSLRRRMVQIRERQEGNLPEHLREQARRLREQAERLEERAEEMEESRSSGREESPSG